MAGNGFFILLFFGLGLAAQATPVSDATAAVPAIYEDVIANQRRNGAASRIVAGWPAEDRQIPHQVSLRMISNVGAVSSCGGSIIHHHWVMTAAHCLANRFVFVVRIGLTNLTRTDNILESTRKYIHPGYWEPSAGVQTDDIALLGIDQYIPYNEFIQPCRLQPSVEKNKDYTGVVLTASGYGLTDDTANGGVTSETLNWVYLRGNSNGQCLAWYPTSQVIRDPTICAEYYNNTAQSSCSGDSGGPLSIVDFDGRPTMVGVASFVSSVGCNSAWPSGWVRPGHYHDWYRQITGLSFDWTISDGAVQYRDTNADVDPKPITFGPADFGPMKPGFKDL